MAEAQQWLSSYSAKLRMEYGHAMSLEGFDPNIIAGVQRRVAESMIEWLKDFA